jgi:clan AA aspartic protease (TIGR02281 family)
VRIVNDDASGPTDSNQGVAVRTIFIRNTLLIAVGGLLLLLGVQLSRAADTAAPSTVAPTGDQSAAAQVFNAKGLTKVDSVLESSDEAPVHAAVIKVQGLKSKVASQAAAMADVARARDNAMDDLYKVEEKLSTLENQLNAAKEQADISALVAARNETLRQGSQKYDKIQELRKREGHIEDFQAAYADAVGAATALAGPASEHYARLAADTTVQAAIESCNRNAAGSLKLGPSPQFSSDIAFLKKCSYALALDTIPVSIDDGGLPNVDVTVNGQTARMIWDSGASSVSLSYETADAMGLHATDKDETVTATVANGQKVQAKLIHVPEMRVGPFLATDVMCEISPRSKLRPPDLLGDAFQGRFLSRLDQQANVLHLMPVDKSVSVAPDAKPAVLPARPVAGAPIAARTPRAIPMPPPLDGQDIFATKGVSKVGFLFEIPGETVIHASAGSVRALKSKVGSESLARANTNRAFDTALHEYDQLRARLAMLGDKLKQFKNNPDQYNQLVDPYNQTLAQLKSKKAVMDQRQQDVEKVADSRQEYVDAAVKAVRDANGISDQYGALAADSALAAAIQKLNTGGSATPLKLGPSAAFATDLRYLRKLASDMANDGLSVRVEGGIPRVDVAINGKTQEMMWDSGASGVSLSAEAASEFGLHVTSKDPTVSVSMADGRSFPCKIVIVPEIRVGPFIARNIECLIWPSAAAKPASLLGTSFQRHFLIRLDEQAGMLHLTPNDDSAETAADSRPWSPDQLVSIAPPPPAPRPDVPPNVSNKTINLLDLVNVSRDAVKGTWTMENGKLLSDGADQSRIEFPYQPPAEYDFRIVFTRTGGENDVQQICTAQGSQFAWMISGWGGTISGFEFVRGKNAYNNPTTKKNSGWLSNNREYVSVVKVRKSGVEAYLDGTLISAWKTDFSDMSIDPAWALKGSNQIAVGAHCVAVFRTVEVTEISGAGRVLK